MGLELFTVYMKEEGTIEVKINEEIIKDYGMTLENFRKKFNTDNLAKCIEDFTKCIND